MNRPRSTSPISMSTTPSTSGAASPRSAPGTPRRALAVTTSSSTWKRLATKKLNPAIALATGGLQVEGGILALRRFLAFFDNH
ncbi:MAG: hypothetical protein HC888_15780 [Candidatus Competibacteraceae bacterium]|nr:hypothetical protein [Candidatus Competibacteraceae bacterium]